VSCIIPVYNGERFVRQAITTVLDQRYPRLVVIVVDEGSTAGSPGVRREFEGVLRVIRQPHRGVAAARNLGLGEAHGDYVAFQDADVHAERVAGPEIVPSLLEPALDPPLRCVLQLPAGNPRVLVDDRLLETRLDARAVEEPEARIDVQLAHGEVRRGIGAVAAEDGDAFGRHARNHSEVMDRISEIHRQYFQE
jgi:glycosyltransferase involved in cell wall biosynthesis